MRIVHLALASILSLGLVGSAAFAQSPTAKQPASNEQKVAVEAAPVAGETPATPVKHKGKRGKKHVAPVEKSDVAPAATTK